MICGVINVKNISQTVKVWNSLAIALFSNRPAIKAHMHNKHNITIFEDDYGGFRRFL